MSSLCLRSRLSMKLARSCSCFDGALISVMAIHSRRIASRSLSM